MTRKSVVIARWALFLPAAFVASHVLTRMAAELSSELVLHAELDNATVIVHTIVFSNQLLSGLAFGYIGVIVSPGPGKYAATVICIMLAIVASWFYVFRYSDLAGVLAAIIHVIATGLGGWIAFAQWLRAESD